MMTNTADACLADALNGTSCWRHGYAQICERSPAVKSVADAFRVEYGHEIGSLRLREFLIFLDGVCGIDAHRIITSNSIDRDAKKAQAIALLVQAAKVLEFSFDFFKDAAASSLDREIPIARRKQTARKLLRRIASDPDTRMDTLIHVLVDVVRSKSVDDLMPIGDRNRYPNDDVDISNIGLSGRAASSPESATHGLLVRELDQRLPRRVADRYAVIRKLLAIKGIVLTRQVIRGILVKGKT